MSDHSRSARGTAPGPASRLAVAALAAATLWAAGCASGPRAPRYLLEPAAVDRVEPLPRALDSLGLETVDLPGYVEDSSLVGRGPDGTLAVDAGAHWSEAPDAALTRTLAESLRLRSGASVLVEPLPRGFEPEARIEIVFDRLLRNGSGGAELGGQARLVAGDGRRLLSVRTFEITRPGRDDSDAAFFEALAIAVDDLARLIVAALRAPA